MCILSFSVDHNSSMVLFFKEWMWRKNKEHK